MTEMQKNPNEDRADLTSGNVRDVNEAVSQTVRHIQETVSANPKLFPHGVNKLIVTAKAMGVEISIDVEGPATAGETEFLEQHQKVRYSPDVVFTIMQRVGRKARGSVQWAAKGLSSPAVSGDSNHDAINLGIWQGIAFQERPGDGPYCDSKNSCWFSVFQDAYGRTDMGIHPDGGVPDATLGCIGIRDADTLPWHEALKGAKGRIVCEVKDGTALEVLDDDRVVEGS